MSPGRMEKKLTEKTGIKKMGGKTLWDKLRVREKIIWKRKKNMVEKQRGRKKTGSEQGT